MLVDTASILQLLQQYVAEQLEDDALKDYMLQILQDEDIYSDVEGLQETLAPFVGDEEQAALLTNALVVLHKTTNTTLLSNPLAESNEKTATVVSRDSNENVEVGSQFCSITPNSLNNFTKMTNLHTQVLLPLGSLSLSKTNHNDTAIEPEPIEQDNTTDNDSKVSNDIQSTVCGKEKRAIARSERRKDRRLQGKDQTKGGNNVRADKGCDAGKLSPSSSMLEDDSSAWQECLEKGQLWGGRGYGGRGEYAGATNSVKSNIHLSNVSLSLPNLGTDLLVNTTIDIVKGHRYGLIGRNGVGKSTLLQRLSQKAIPGMPLDMRILLVQQQIEGSDTKSALQILMDADVDRKNLLAEQEAIERRFESTNISDQELAAAAERLNDIATELDAIGADEAEKRAVDILRGLQFTKAMIDAPTMNLSGGWRMRLSLARALFVTSDLLLFDECTNHLDLHGLDWLISYLREHEDRTLIVVSHDRSFLDAICTDVICMEHQRLSYHVGSFSDYERQIAEKSARESQILDAAERQRSKAEAFIQKQQTKTADPNKQRQAKMIKEKKLDRIGNYREDGKKYKLRSLSKLSEDHLRLAQKVEVEVDEPIIKLRFPNPTWPPSISENDALVRLEGFTFGFTSDRLLFSDITLNLNRGSKIALVGKNGVGKSTLMKLFSGDLITTDCFVKGELWRHPNLRIGHVTQYAVEELEKYGSQTVLQYAEEQLIKGKASAEIIAKAAGNIRQYLGSFGLGGRHAHQPMNKLSGGERMRLCFATVLAEEPHLLLLDESTNHVDIETLDSMSAALNKYKGSVLMVSHNQSFLSGFCNELWTLENGHVTVLNSDTASFDELFSDYRNAVYVQGDKSRSAQRQVKANLAKRATQHRTGVEKPTSLL